MAGCGGKPPGGTEMEYTLQQSPTRTAYLGHSDIPGYAYLSWTPVLRFGGGNTGMTGTFIGNYVRLGNLIIATYTISLSAKGSSSGTAVISGLPYFSSQKGTATNLSHQFPVYFENMATSLIQVLTYLVGALTDSFELIKVTAATASLSGRLGDTDFNDTSIIGGTFIYTI